MPEARDWTPEEISRAKKMRADGMMWWQIGAHFGVGRWCMSQCAKKYGFWSEAISQKATPSVPEAKTGHKDRPPLRAGDEYTWGLITKNTCLEGMSYPIPPPVL